jgi:hypothetical protein
MKIIKTWQLFTEAESTKLLTMNLPKFLDSIQLFHTGDHIWTIKIEDSHSRAMLFLRAQEYYESAFENIIRKQFQFSKYMDTYKQHYGKQEFTYGEDWSGFNIPSTILEECMMNIPEVEMNNYDKIMIDIIKTIKSYEGDSKYYILGVDELNNDLLEHEFAHAMYFTLPEYKKEMDRITSECDDEIKAEMFKCITDYGYADHVLPDEFQAYMATGLGSAMEDAEIEDIDEWMVEFREVFEEYYHQTLYPTPKKIEIKYETFKKI